MIDKEQLITYLTDIGIYDAVDEYLIDDFLYYLELKERAKETLLETGLVLNIARPENNPYYQKSPALGILNECTKNLLNISRKLGLSPFDRANLKIQISDNDDGFD